MPELDRHVPILRTGLILNLLGTRVAGALGAPTSGVTLELFKPAVPTQVQFLAAVPVGVRFAARLLRAAT